MARWLAGQGFRVTMLTWDEGQPEEVLIEGVRVIKMCRPDAGLPGLRFLYPRWTSLWRGLRRAAADVYYHNSAEYVTGQVALWCRLHRRRFVYSVASDPACDARLRVMPTRRERILYRYGIRHADRVVVQTHTQQRLLLENFGRDSAVIPMPCPGPPDDLYEPPRPPEQGPAHVLWVGRIAEMKRPELLLDLAAALPNLHFDLVGAPDVDSPYARDLLVRARALSNVTVHGRLSRDRLQALYRGALCLCCTSRYEGFPNTFLEAWSHGLPVVATVDPDGLIAERGLGAVSFDLAGLVAAVRRLLVSAEDWYRFSANCRRYYCERHSMDTAMAKFDQLFRQLAAPPATHGLRTSRRGNVV